ncbi:hypothetical protein EC988_003292 [Linderina pennispora]|nr:hypothetical protein EC988_003292 [Linderina pennispora]
MKFSLAAIAGIFAVGVQAAAVKPTLYIFGDSLSDVGTLKKLTFGLIPPKPYWNGRFSSGPAWNEYLSLKLGYNLYNKAVGGATSDNSITPSLPFGLPVQIPSSQDQINWFRSANPNYSQSNMRYADIAVLEIGANDFLVNLFSLAAGTKTPESFAERLSNEVISQMDQLKAIGFRNIVVPNLAAIQLTPLAHMLKVQGITNTTVTYYNNMLAQKVAAWKATAGIGFVTVADVAKFLAVTQMPSVTVALGLEDVSTSCVGGNLLDFVETDNFLAALINFFMDAKNAIMCSNPGTNYFFDPIHPAERIQRLFGYLGFEMVKTTLQGGTYDINEANILNIIKTYSLNSPAPKPASI